MRALAVSLSLLVAAAAGCAKTSADTATRRADEGARAAERAERREAAEHKPTPLEGETDLPVSVTGVFLDPSLATACGIPVVPEAYFAYDSAKIEPGDNILLHEVANCLTTGPLRGRSVELRGHTDPRGSEGYNEKLGMSRAATVGDYLSQHGVAPETITVKSAGEAGAAPETPSDWPYERRVDIVLLPVE